MAIALKKDEESSRVCFSSTRAQLFVKNAALCFACEAACVIWYELGIPCGTSSRWVRWATALSAPPPSICGTLGDGHILNFFPTFPWKSLRWWKEHRNIKAHKGAESMLSLFGDFQDAKTSGTWQSALKAWECRGRPWMSGLANMFSVFLSTRISLCQCTDWDAGIIRKYSAYNRRKFRSLTSDNMQSWKAE